MLPTVRGTVVVVVPAIASLFGIFWLQRRRKKKSSSERELTETSECSRDNSSVRILSETSVCKNNEKELLLLDSFESDSNKDPLNSNTPSSEVDLSMDVNPESSNESDNSCFRYVSVSDTPVQSESSDSDIKLNCQSLVLFPSLLIDSGSEPSCDSQITNEPLQDMPTVYNDIIYPPSEVSNGKLMNGFEMTLDHSNFSSMSERHCNVLSLDRSSTSEDSFVDQFTNGTIMAGGVENFDSTINFQPLNVDNSNIDPLVLVSSYEDDIWRNYSVNTPSSGTDTSTFTPDNGVSLCAVPMDGLCVFCFEFPRALCGLLIGKHGRTINSISTKSGTNIIIESNPFSEDMQIISVEGSPEQIANSLELIKRRFPSDRYPEITYNMSAVNKTDEQIVQFNSASVMLFGKGPHDVLVSSIVNVNHIFIHLLNASSYAELQTFTQSMTTLYEMVQGFEIKRPLLTSQLCAIKVNMWWYRVVVIEYHCFTDECDIKYVDFGGYSRVQTSHLRKLRQEFLEYAWQAVECHLFNVIPARNGFNANDLKFLEECVRWKNLKLRVDGFAEDGNPLVTIYEEGKPFNINQELVLRGHAKLAF